MAILAALGDPGLFGARELIEFPVIGISESAMLTACMLGGRFLIVTFASLFCGGSATASSCTGLKIAAPVALDHGFGSLEDVRETNWEALVKLALLWQSKFGKDFARSSASRFCGGDAWWAGSEILSGGLRRSWRGSDTRRADGCVRFTLLGSLGRASARASSRWRRDGRPATTTSCIISLRAACGTKRCWKRNSRSRRTD